MANNEEKQKAKESIDKDILPDFIADTEEHITSAEENFLLLASGGYNQDVVNTAYRNVHSIKGNCGFIHLYELQDLCHVMETVMGEIRAKTLDVTQDNISFLLEYLDVAQKVVSALGNETGDGSVPNLDALKKKAENTFPAAFGIKTSAPSPAATQAAPKVEKAKPAPTPAPTPQASPAPVKKEEPKKVAETPKAELAKVETAKVEAKKVETAKVEPAKTEPAKVEAAKVEPVKTEAVKVEPAKIEAAKETAQKVETAQEKPVAKPAEKPAQPQPQNEKQVTVKKPTAIKTAAQMEEEMNKIVISDDMRIGFIADSTEQLISVEEDFLLLEKNGFDIEKINSAYRNIHSFKGNCAFMRLDDYKTISHTVETILQAVRDEKIKITKELITFFLHSLDMLQDGVAIFEQGGDTKVQNIDEYRAGAENLFPECFEIKPKENKIEINSQETPSTDTDAEKIQNTIAGVNEIIETSMTVPQAINSGGGRATPQHQQQGQGVRVDLRKLESIINLAGELVIAESMVTRNPTVISLADEALNRSVHQLRRICNDLQDAAMTLRMVPLSGTFKKMTRLVHDLSSHIGKKINLVTINGEAEVDKTVSELINDPLIHIIRNACDHGIGTPEERLANGKPEYGTITISAEHKSGAVWITVKDDGRGLNRDKILNKAIQQKIISPDDVLTDDEIWKLILLPGFSTASIVSDISGRGVGMDVVQKNVEAIRGQIFIKTVQDKGTEFIIRIPLTLAIIDGMIIKVRGSLYIIPTLSIKQSLKYDEAAVTYSPEGEKILKFQDKLIPIVNLANLFEKEQRDCGNNGILIVVEESDFVIAIFADDIVGQQQVVIKGLSDYIQKARGTSSCTILGDGSIALILDINTLSQMALEKVEKNRKIPVVKQSTNKPLKI